MFLSFNVTLFGLLSFLSLRYVDSQLLTRILGGTPTSINTYPVVAQLLLDSWGNQQFVQHCAGVILTSRHVISTAHCFQFNVNTGRNYTNPKHWKVRVGSSFRSKGGSIYNVKTIVPHPEFDKYYYTNDIAVLVLTKKMVFGAHVAQGTIATFKSEVRDNALCTLVGWGFVNNNGPQAEQLQHATMYTIEQEVCRIRYNTIGAAIMNSMFCAGILNAGGVDGCFGDSGGPLIYKGVVIGLVSFGYDCGHRYYPGVYTKISQFTNWIVNTIDKNK